MKGRAISWLVLFAVLAISGPARADEIRLKDGTKITGTIVGYENDSFKIETAYGFALVRKDKIAEIIPAAPAKESEPKPEPKTKAATPVTSAAAAAKEPSSTTAAPPNANASATARPPITANASPAAAPAGAPPAPLVAPTPAAASALPVATVAPAPAATPPPVIHDEIRGNLYVNLTYGFQMYKPPSWQLIPGARNELPNAVAALGTNDETTLLVIGRERATGSTKDSSKDSLDAYAAATEKTLSEVYENYRLISGRRTMVGQAPAIERRFRGTADGHDWSVILLTFPHGNDFFTLLGMTWADSDLIQVEENVIEKAANSLTFTAQ